MEIAFWGLMSIERMRRAGAEVGTRAMLPGRDVGIWGGFWGRKSRAFSFRLGGSPGRLRVHCGFNWGLGGAKSGSQFVLKAPPQAEGQAQAGGCLAQPAEPSGVERGRPATGKC